MFPRFAHTLRFQFNFLKMLGFFLGFPRYRQIRPSDCHQFWDAHQIICDQVEHEGPGHARNSAQLGLAHGSMLLAPAEHALDHRPAGLRHRITRMARGAAINRAATAHGDVVATFAIDPVTGRVTRVG